MNEKPVIDKQDFFTELSRRDRRDRRQQKLHGVKPMRRKARILQEIRNAE